jgi:hypothetical protein
MAFWGGGCGRLVKNMVFLQKCMVFGGKIRIFEKGTKILFFSEKCGIFQTLPSPG